MRKSQYTNHKSQTTFNCRKARLATIIILSTLLYSEVFAFTASYEQTVSGTGIDKPQKNAVKIKDTKVRMEVDGPNGKTITIIDGNTVYSYLSSEKRAIKLLNKKPLGMEVLSDYRTYLISLAARVIGSQKIGSYDCDIYEFTDPRLNAVSKVWLWREKEFPIKVETRVPGGAVITLMENVNIGDDIDDSEFILPPGMEIIDFMEALRNEDAH